MNEIIGIVLALVAALASGFFVGRSSSKRKKAERDLTGAMESKRNYEKVSQMDDDAQLAEFDRLREKRR